MHLKQSLEIDPHITTHHKQWGAGLLSEWILHGYAGAEHCVYLITH